MKSFSKQFENQVRRMGRKIDTGACAQPTEGCDVPVPVRPVNPAILPSTVHRNWWVISSLNPDGTDRTDVQTGAVLGFAGNQCFLIEVPPNYGLWSLFVLYPTVNGLVQLGNNHPPFRVRVGVVFNLGKYEFPVPLCGPLKVYIQGGVVPGDPVVAVPVDFMAVIAEV